MSLMSIMYHHVNSDAFSNKLEIFEEHLRYIKAHFTPVVTGDEISGECVCLTFDDAYADFYFLVYPLLKKYQIKAMLAVSSKYILEDSQQAPQKRMGIPHYELFDRYKEGTCCTFKEMEEMVASNLVKIASHSHTHANLADKNTDLTTELKTSKAILEERLKVEVDSLILPYGKYNKEVLKEAKKYYRYVFRIGNALHKDFTGIHGLTYRVNGDELKHPDEIFRMKNLLKYHAKGLLKRIAS